MNPQPLITVHQAIEYEIYNSPKIIVFISSLWPRLDKHIANYYTWRAQRKYAVYLRYYKSVLQIHKNNG